MTGELTEKLAGRRVVASVSGGKDSAALSLWLTEQGIEHDRVFLDTGWEHNATYDYLRGPLTRAIGAIVEVRGEKQMEELIRSKAMFPSRIKRFCTTELKVKPMQRFLNKRVADGEELVNAVGIRAAESAARSMLAEWEWSDGFDCEVWRPLIAWSEQDVIDVHTRHGLKPNPLYLMGAARVGCWPCIYARKNEIRLIAGVDPARIDRIRALEAEISTSRRERRAERGLADLGEAAWFQSSTPAVVDGETRYPMVPIDKAVEWSRTSRGGKQFEMFAASGRDAGCMRWGLCETNPPEELVQLKTDAASGDDGKESA